MKQQLLQHKDKVMQWWTEPLTSGTHAEYCVNWWRVEKAGSQVDRWLTNKGVWHVKDTCIDAENELNSTQEKIPCIRAASHKNSLKKEYVYIIWILPKLLSNQN